MSKKSKVLKAFLILAAAIAICMYFSRTIQTITTPKVKLVTADVGRIEQKVAVALSPYFPVKTEITLTKAKDYPITVDKVYVKTGLYVEKGDTILTAVINDYDKKEKELTDSYAKKAQELIELDITNRKNSKQSMQNDLYDDMIAKQDALSEAESMARLAAAKEGLELSYDQSTWLAKAQSAKASSEVTSLIRAAVTAKQNFDQARQDFFDSYENKKIKVADDVFKYIKSRNALVKELQQLSDDMVALQEAQQSMSVVTASSAGYVVGLDLKSGDVYSGDKILYTIAKEEDKPVLRADVTDLKKDVSEGAKVEVKGDYSTYRTKVSQIVNDSDGRKYAEMEMTDDILYAAGGMSKLMENGSIDAKIVFRSRKNATIIPASALRSEGGTEYVFVAQYNYGGVLSSSGMTAKKTAVTVIDRSDTQVSVEEDLGWQQIIDKADRTVEDGKPVMEYTE